MDTNASARVASQASALPSSQTQKLKVQTTVREETVKAQVKDRLELSDSAKALQNPSSQAKSPEKTPDAAKPSAKSPSQWDQDRLARIDQLELLLHKGQYRVEPFMVDEIALRLARSMVTA